MCPSTDGGLFLRCGPLHVLWGRTFRFVGTVTSISKGGKNSEVRNIQLRLRWFSSPKRLFYQVLHMTTREKTLFIVTDAKEQFLANVYCLFTKVAWGYLLRGYFFTLARVQSADAIHSVTQPILFTANSLQFGCILGNEFLGNCRKSWHML
jgi:hypothetical protein